MTWLTSKQQMVARDKALPGRAERMPVPAAHLVNGHALQPPFPAGLQQAIFALGCFWGAEKIFWQLAIEDIKAACDAFQPLYEESHGGDGYVSLEVNPHLAHDTNGTIDEARRLWAALNRPNVFIKVPATREGLPAIRQLISEGINVNITLLFGLPRYREVAEAYLAGLEARRQGPGELGGQAGIAGVLPVGMPAGADDLLQRHGDRATRRDLARLRDQPGLDLRPRVWYNPEMRSANFMVPGVVGLILQILSMISGIVRWRSGSMVFTVPVMGLSG